MDLKSKFLGAIVGCAVGDALGAPYEGRSRSFMHDKRGLTKRFEKIPGYPTGQYTDDTQMTLALCESIINKRRVDGADIAAKFANLWRNNTIIGEGMSCRDAMMQIIVNGVSWDEAGTQHGRAGNGSAMRASPVGLFDCGDLAALKRDALTQSIITHKDERASSGSVAVCAAIYYCINNENIDPNNFIDFIYDITVDVSAEFAENILELKEIITYDDDAAFQKIAPIGQGAQMTINGVTPFIIPTVMAALYHFLQTPRDWSKSVEGAIRFGGDTDTVASITGAISGSYNGYDSIPRSLTEELKDKEYIHGVALKLYEVCEEVHSGA